MDLLMYTVSIHVPVVQVLVGIFLFVNCLMIFTFLKKEDAGTFITTLPSDTLT